MAFVLLLMIILCYMQQVILWTQICCIFQLYKLKFKNRNMFYFPASALIITLCNNT